MSAVPKLDLERIRRFCDSRIPTNLRNEVRVEVGVRGKSVTIFECRPLWHPKLTDWSKTSIAQLRYDPDAEDSTLTAPIATAVGTVTTSWSRALWRTSWKRSTKTPSASSGVSRYDPPRPEMTSPPSRGTPPERHAQSRRLASPRLLVTFVRALRGKRSMI